MNKMEFSEMLAIITFVVTLVCGVITKKLPKISNKIIPIQNLLIGVIVAVVEWIITKNFSTAIALSGLLAGGTYDIFNNLNKLSKYERE